MRCIYIPFALCGVLALLPACTDVHRVPDGADEPEGGIIEETAYDPNDNWIAPDSYYYDDWYDGYYDDWYYDPYADESASGVAADDWYYDDWEDQWYDDAWGDDWSDDDWDDYGGDAGDP